MSALSKALETVHSYEFTNEECMALMGAIDDRIRFLRDVIVNEAASNPVMAKVAEADKDHLERVLNKLGF